MLPKDTSATKWRSESEETRKGEKQFSYERESSSDANTKEGLRFQFFRDNVSGLYGNETNQPPIWT